ncbi:MAG: DUF5110 domain-containing protein [Clostridiales bacterium]|nr:DUF5110 domain-containing protein [Clostridiales bacterium]
MKNFIIGNVRVQLLSYDVIRVEYGKAGEFEDAPSFFIPDRNFYDGGIEATLREADGGAAIEVGDVRLFVPYGSKELDGVKLIHNGATVYTYRAKKNGGELPPIGKTPFVFALSDNPRIVCPKDGYTAKGDPKYKITKNARDIYLLVCRNDPKKLRRLYVTLTGRNELVRLSTLGNWNSRYYKYTQAEAEKMIDTYIQKRVPLDNMVIDTDWREACDRGIGYDINTKLFPDMKGFFDYAHARNIEIMFNDHPEPLGGARSALDPKEIAYREEKLTGILDMGLDTWWYDRNWFTALVSPVKDVRPETLGMYLFEEITKHYYAGKAGSDKVYRRPVIMANVNNIHNGKYIKINDSASHRYSIQWTGDIHCRNEYLLQEIKNLVRATGNCIPYVNFDCGGHIGNPDKELYLRWMKFGAFSPILRPHCTISVKKFREPWNYDEETVDVVREYVNMRYRLLPTTYKHAYENYLTGEPIYKSLGFTYPSDRASLSCDRQYMLGDDVMIAPVYGDADIPAVVPKACFTTPVKATYYRGTDLEGKAVAVKEYSYINQEYDKTTPVKELGPYNYSAVFEFKLKFDTDAELYVCNDDGTRLYVDGELVLDDWTFHAAYPQKAVSLKKGVEYSVKMDYMQAGGEAVVKLLYKKLSEKADPDSAVKKHPFYIPEDGYINVFDGTKYSKGKHVAYFGIKDYPIFVRPGSVLALGKNAQTTAEQTWNELAFDIYPSKERKAKSYLYEDDRQTTAYKYGVCRKQGYSLEYDKGENAVIFTLDKAEGSYDGADKFSQRSVSLRYHLSMSCGEIDGVYLNGEEVPFEIIPCDKDAYPFGFDGGAPDGDIAEVKLTLPLDKSTEVRFKLK